MLWLARVNRGPDRGHNVLKEKKLPRREKAGSYWGSNPLERQKHIWQWWASAVAKWTCQFCILLGAIFHANTTTLHLIIPLLSPSDLSSTSLTTARTNTSEVQFLHQFFTNLIPLRDKRCVDGYFRPEAGDVVMLDMIDSSQDKSGKTEGRSSRGLAHWKGLSVGRWWSMTFCFDLCGNECARSFCVGKWGSNRTLLYDSHNGFSSIISLR